MFADVILPLAFSGQTFSYAIPEGMPIEVGFRVIVPLGASKQYAGIVARVHDRRPMGVVKSVTTVIDQVPIFTPLQIKLMEWMAAYYMCPIGQVLRIALPSGIRSAAYTPPTLVAVDLAHGVELEAIHQTLHKKKAALKSLDIYLSLQQEAENPQPITKKQLIAAGASPIGIKTLLEHHFFIQTELPAHHYTAKAITKTEQSALVGKMFGDDRPTVLFLHQADSTYIRVLAELIAHTSAEDKISLIIAPDNYSCRALCDALSGFQVICYDTKSSITSRSESYLRVTTAPESVDVVVGTRPALLLPYQNLGLVVVVEEGDYGHKSSDHAPLSNARDTAIMLAADHTCRLVLTTHAPSMECYANVYHKKWGLIHIGKEEAPAPVKLLEKGKKELFSSYLLRRMEQTLESGGQTVILQNRRGFASSLLCSDCGYIPKCMRCNVMLTMHYATKTLNCHYCGYSIALPKVCPSCGSPNIAPQGMGTERVVEQLADRFPSAQIARVDSDSVARSNAFGELKRDIEDAKADIIVGTQLILRGLRPPNIQLVAVVNADNMFLSTDFRTSERALCALLRLRAMVGPNGEMIIQSSDTQNPTLKVLEWNEIQKFYAKELAERQAFHYPPFVRLVVLRLAHYDRGKLLKFAAEVDKRLAGIFGNRVSPPYEPLIDKLNNKYIVEMMVRFERSAALPKMKQRLTEELDAIRKINSWVDLVIDVDPL